MGLPEPTGARYSSWRKNRLEGCSFCNKSQEDVQRVIAGPGVYICDECVDICLKILEEEGGRKPDPELPRPDPVPST